MEDNTGRTGFMDACSCGRKEIVALLLDKTKIVVHKQTRKCETALVLACRRNQKEVVELLLKHPKILVNKRDSDDTTAFMKACAGHTIPLDRGVRTRSASDWALSDTKYLSLSVSF